MPFPRFLYMDTFSKKNEFSDKKTWGVQGKTFRVGGLTESVAKEALRLGKVLSMHFLLCVEGT